MGSDGLRPYGGDMGTKTRSAVQCRASHAGVLVLLAWWQRVWPPGYIGCTVAIVASALAFVAYDGPVEPKVVPVALHVAAVTIMWFGPWRFRSTYKRLRHVVAVSLGWITESHIAFTESARLLHWARDQFDNARSVRADRVPWCARCGGRLRAGTRTSHTDGIHAHCRP
jgi:hypothetical protein